MLISPILPSLPSIPKVNSAIAGDITTLTATGTIVDSGMHFDDAVTTNQNVWSAEQTATFVIDELLNVPSLPTVQFATTANDTKSGLAARDGYTPVAGNFALVKNQTNNDNGIFRCTSGTWVRQKVVAGAYTDVTTDTTYATLGIDGGVINVLNGTVNKNLQFQIYIQNTMAIFAATPVYVTAVTKLPVASTENRFVDGGTGNDTNNNGSSAFPFATLAKALVGASFPLVVTMSPTGAADASAVTWTSGQANSLVQSQSQSASSGQTAISAQQSFASGSTRNHFKGIAFSTGSMPPFAFASGALCRNYLQDLVFTTTASDLLGLNAGVANWINLDNISVTNAGLSNINLPAFTNPFTFYIRNQTPYAGSLIFTGTGAASTVISIASSCTEGLVRLPSSYLGAINWNGAAFGAQVGSTALPSGIITSQTQLTTVLAWTTDTTYDGYYLISGFTPTSFSAGAIFGKQTIGGVATNTWWARTFAQAPASISSINQITYQQSVVGGFKSWVTAPAPTTVATITAGTNAQGQGALTGTFNIVASTPNNPSGVTLPAASPAASITVFNSGTNPINVFPAAGGAIDSLATNSAIKISVGGAMTFDGSSSTQWLSTFNQTVGGSTAQQFSVANATTASQAIAFAQSTAGYTLQDVTVSRAMGVTYTNSTARTITVCVVGNWGASSNTGVYVLVNGFGVGWAAANPIGYFTSLVFPVPPGATYAAMKDGTTTGTLQIWREFR